MLFVFRKMLRRDGFKLLQYERDVSENALPTTPGGLVRVPGGRAAIPKKVTADLDEEDKILFDMKQQGYTDDAVAKYLVDQGLTKYKTQSVGSRFTRIKKVLQQKNEELLDEELTDWHDGEVCLPMAMLCLLLTGLCYRTTFYSLHSSRPTKRSCPSMRESRRSCGNTLLKK